MICVALCPGGAATLSRGRGEARRRVWVAVTVTRCQWKAQRTCPVAEEQCRALELHEPGYETGPTARDSRRIAGIHLCSDKSEQPGTPITAQVTLLPSSRYSPRGLHNNTHFPGRYSQVCVVLSYLLLFLCGWDLLVKVVSLPVASRFGIWDAAMKSGSSRG